jgi:hypothetical protein
VAKDDERDEQAEGEGRTTKKSMAASSRACAVTAGACTWRWSTRRPRGRAGRVPPGCAGAFRSDCPEPSGGSVTPPLCQRRLMALGDGRAVVTIQPPAAVNSADEGLDGEGGEGRQPSTRKSRPAANGPTTTVFVAAFGRSLDESFEPARFLRSSRPVRFRRRCASAGESPLGHNHHGRRAHRSRRIWLECGARSEERS